MILVYLIWPLLAVYESIRNYRESWAKNGIWLFVIFFGFTFVPREGNDSWGYVQSLKDMHNADMDLNQLFRMLYVEGSRYLDMIQLLITFLVSRFTGDGRILFAVFGALYGYFYSRNIWFIISSTEGKLGMVEKILIIVIAFVIPIWSMNGVRFWTAAHIFIFGALQILLYRNMKGFLIAAFSILMHFSFILPLFILGAYIVAGNRTVFYFVFFVVSLVISGIDPLILRTVLLQYLPGIFHDRIYSYTNPDYLDDVNYAYETATFYARYYKPVMRIGVSSLLILVFISGKKFWNDVKVRSVYSFSLLFAALMNIISGLGSLGRFERVAQLIGLAGVFMFFYILPKNHKSRKWFYIFLPFLLFYLFTVFRKGLDNTGIYSLISNPIFTPFLPNDMALIDLIK